MTKKHIQNKIGELKVLKVVGERTLCNNFKEKRDDPILPALVPALIEKEMQLNHQPYIVRIVYSRGDFICFIKQYDENGTLVKPVTLIHFGHRNTDYRGYYYEMKNEHGEFAEIVKEIAYRIYEKGNWSNNDRKRNGLKPINVKNKMEKHNKRMDAV